MTNQANDILEFLLKHGSINRIQAVNECDCFELAARIGEIKKAGFTIRTERKNYTNHKGIKKHYVKYILEATP